MKVKCDCQEEDLDALVARDYSKVKDPSLLRFLVDIRGESCDNKQVMKALLDSNRASTTCYELIV
jgi:hypothetical protein